MKWSTNCLLLEVYLARVRILFLGSLCDAHDCPVVYDIKCILDETLDALENLTDAIINAIEPILQGIISDASRTACNSGIAVVGLCILP